MSEKYRLSKFTLVKWIFVRTIVLLVFFAFLENMIIDKVPVFINLCIQSMSLTVCFFIAIIISFIDYFLWSYYINDKYIELRFGIIFRRIICIPIDRIKYIDLVQDPISMILKIKSIKIYTAGGKSKIPGVDYNIATYILELVKENS